MTGHVVSDSANAGLVGVSVTVKGSTTSTSTNTEGAYSISIPDRNNVVLIFTSVGYKRQEVSVGNKTVVDVTLSEESSSL
ncbi:MAG TPA: carboxypeptidase-like regulatory domain-containing protein, partial [Flavisolibacter sp.]|nr:carboxypeptidase-like regulatory domain-containing protein [Flavisolibacter sp.]